ncbi:unnamed protein product [Diplocarpon coronariae]|uniref:Uncharacterized protein n=1 Tax=Diplocarpon coronariae TaxID=2795749 RepID=A0A218ZD32_9HELO|nr:hypothetical protein JHW43_005427 [Diplocarpon mali]OWP05908.1 hypothetical protein B2J93_6232 [Marssonina coronariae]
MPRTTFLAFTPALPSELLTYILTHQAYPTTLLICQPRANFLSALARCVPNTVQRRPPPSRPRSSSAPLDDTEIEDQAHLAAGDKERYSGHETKHPLLTATLQQVATSRFVELAFVPTLSHLRAYLAVFPPPQVSRKGSGPPHTHFEKEGDRKPLVVVYGLVGLHRDTSEWSAQGLGDTVAGLVEAGKRSGRCVVVVEEKTRDFGNDGQGGRVAWGERLPILNGSVRRPGLESEDGAWSGRTVEVGRVLGRWFAFKRGEWDEDL